MTATPEDLSLLSLADHLPALVFLEARDHSIPYANRYVTKRFGDYRDKRCHELFRKSGSPCAGCQTEKAFKSWKPDKWEIDGADGRVYQIYATPFAGSQSSPLLLKLGLDITERRKREDEIFNKRKLESISVLAGGIAHDYNNLLTSILGNISLAKMLMNYEDEAFEVLTKAEKSSLSAKDLTYQLLKFASKEKPVFNTVSIADLIRSAAAEALANTGVTYELSPPDGLWPVDADINQMGQVFRNIILNCLEHMQNTCLITFKCENINSAEEGAYFLNEGNYVKVSVIDYGSGMPGEYLRKIFDPYFTSKEMGIRKGAGFGLAIAYSIIRNHNGFITADSKIGSGTTFHIFLPAAVRPQQESKGGQ